MFARRPHEGSVQQLFQLLNADSITGKQIWHREKTAEFCLRSPQPQLSLFSQQDLAELLSAALLYQA